MRRLYCIVLAILIFPTISSARETERILSYLSQIQVHEDGSMTVTEVIRVYAAGDAIKRGIYRTFPTRYKNRHGRSVKITFDVLDVRKDARPEPYHTEQMSNGIKLYIGDANVFLDRGIYTYMIVYRTDRQLGYFDDFDELYWNATGNDWNFTIEYAEAVVELPPGARIIKSVAYTGAQEEQGSNYSIGYDTTGRIKFSTLEPLQPYEGLTIAVSWPKGIIPEPSFQDNLLYAVKNPTEEIAGLAGILAILFYYVLIWARVGKDPPKGTIIPQFKPPDGYSPAATRYVMRMGYSDRVFASAIVNMAVKGYIKIQERKGEFTVQKTGADNSILSRGEQKIAIKLFANRDILEFKQPNHSRIRGAVNALKAYLKLELEKMHFEKNSGYILPGILLTLATLGIIIVSSRGRAETLMMTVCLSGWTIGCAALFYAVAKSWISTIASRGMALKNLAGTIVMTLFSIPFLIGEVFGIVAFSIFTSFITVLIVILAILLNFFFFHLLKAPTILGRSVMDQIEGFKMYLETAEKGRMNTMLAQDQTPALFEKYLPYALALGVENQWCEKFSDVINQSGKYQDYSPAWYSGGNFRPTNLSGFATTLGASFSSRISSSSSAPGSSSGSSGGGFSGGGGGGGGGGGW
ncbi:MAG: DUF2207 domain-containing protein [candidate division KSB1 bacterium]|jgi:hypothetical protein|nr:DUF2207 domain-containing protein [candidate division KSB1 bacterium]